MWIGTLLALAATVAGCLTIFYYARWWRHRLVIEKFPDKVKRIDNFISNNPFTMTLVVRLFPVGSNLFNNLAAGVSQVKVLPFLLASVLGYLPHTFIFALIGSGITVDPHLRISVGVAGFIVSSLLGIYLYSKFRNGKSLVNETPTINTRVDDPPDSPTGSNLQQ